MQFSNAFNYDLCDDDVGTHHSRSRSLTTPVRQIRARAARRRADINKLTSERVKGNKSNFLFSPVDGVDRKRVRCVFGVIANPRGARVYDRTGRLVGARACTIFKQFEICYIYPSTSATTYIIYSESTIYNPLIACQQAREHADLISLCVRGRALALAH